MAKKKQWIHYNSLIFSVFRSSFHLTEHCYYQAHPVSQSIIIVLTIHYSGHCDALLMLIHSPGTNYINLLSTDSSVLHLIKDVCMHCKQMYI